MERRRARGSGGFESYPVRSIEGTRRNAVLSLRHGSCSLHLSRLPRRSDRIVEQPQHRFDVERVSAGDAKREAVEEGGREPAELSPRDVVAKLPLGLLLLEPLLDAGGSRRPISPRAAGRSLWGAQTRFRLQTAPSDVAYGRTNRVCAPHTPTLPAPQRASYLTRSNSCTPRVSQRRSAAAHRLERRYAF
jgi:hypothetical protein